MKLAWTKMIFCCTFEADQVISVTLTETSALVNLYPGPLLISKLLQLFQVQRVSTPDCMFQLLPHMFNRI